MKQLFAIACFCGFGVLALGQSNCNGPAAQPITTIDLPAHPFGIVPTSDGCHLFVSLISANPRSPNGVAVLDRAAGKLKLRRIASFEDGPTGMVLTHDGQLLIAADNAYVVFLSAKKLLEGDEDPILGYLSDGHDAGSVYVNVTKDDRYLFVSDEDAASISVIDLTKARHNGFKEDAIIGGIPVGTAPIALTFSPDGKLLYTTSELAQDDWKWPTACKPEGADSAKAAPQYPEGAVIVVDVEKAKTNPAHAVISRAPAGCSPVRLALMPSGDTAWVTVRGNNAVAVFDTAKLISDPQHARVATISVGQSPVGVAIVENGKRVLTTNSNRFDAGQKSNQTLTVIDPSRSAEGAAAILGHVPAGLFPREFAQSPDGKTLFVGNFNSNNIEMIDLAHMPMQPPDSGGNPNRN